MDDSPGKGLDWIKYHKLLLILLGIYFLAALMPVVKFANPGWDESVYIGMGKYFYSCGEKGLFEEIRPPGLPFVQGIFWWLGFEPVIAAKILSILFALAYLVVIYALAYHVFDRRIAFLSVFLAAITPTLFVGTYSSLTDIPSATLAVFSIYSWLKWKNAWVPGIISGFAFLFRFPAGLIVVPVSLAIAYEYRKDLLRVIGKLFSFGAAFSLTIIPFFIFNYFMYRDVTSRLWHALFRPIILASWHQGNPAEAVQASGIFAPLYVYLFYFIWVILVNPFLLFGFVGLYFLASKRRPKGAVLIVSAFIVIISYHSLITNKQYRFALSFLPFIAIMAGYGMYRFFESIRKRHFAYSIAFSILFIAFSFVVVGELKGAVMKIPNTDDGFHLMIKKVFSGVEGPVYTSHPYPSSQVDNLFIPLYYSSSDLVRNWEASESTTLVFSPDAFWCDSGNNACSLANERVLEYLMRNYNLLFHGSHDDDTLFIFSKDFNLESINLEERSLAKAVMLEMNPLGRVQVIIREDDAAAVYREDGKNGIWEFDMFTGLNDYLNSQKIPVMWAVIPNDLVQMNEANLSFLKSYFRSLGTVYIGQHGFDHKDAGKSSEFFGKPYKEQYDAVLKGRLILESVFQERPRVFVPPFDKADSTTSRVLQEQGFMIYSSNPWETIDTLGLSRYDTTIDIVDSWTHPRVKSLEQLKKEFGYLQTYRDFIVITIHHYTLRDGGLDITKQFIDDISGRGVSFTTFLEADRWYDYRSKADFRIENKTIFLDAPMDLRSDNLTLSFSVGGNFNYRGNLTRFTIRNAYHHDIQVCIENEKRRECRNLMPKETELVEFS